MNIDEKIEKLSDTVGKKLSKLHWTISTAESLTAGMLSSALSSIPGASKYLKGGVCAYTDEIKRKVLEVDGGLLLTNTAVDKDVAYQMALGVRDLCGSSVAISTTGYAGNVRDTDLSPDGTLSKYAGVKPAEEIVGLVYIGIISPKKSVVRKFDFTEGNEPKILTREYVQKLTVLNALVMVKDAIEA